MRGVRPCTSLVNLASARSPPTCCTCFSFKPLSKSSTKGTGGGGGSAVEAATVAGGVGSLRVAVGAARSPSDDDKAEQPDNTPTMVM